MQLWERKRRKCDLGLFDQGVERTNTTSIARGHAIDFIHDQTCLVGDWYASSIRRLVEKVIKHSV